MRVNRTLLYTGVFVAAIGAALLAADLGQPSAGALIEVLGLWPLAVIALGVGLVLRRTPLGLVSGVLAAAVPGLVLGGALALSPRLAVERGYWHEVRSAFEHSGLPDVRPDIDFDTLHLDHIGGPT
jgi:hypothetical protein